MIKKIEGGGWLVDIQPGGRSGKRIKRKFDTQAEAKRFVHLIESKAIDKPWNPVKPDARKMSVLVDAWWTSHGQHLSDGKNMKSRLLFFCAQIADPPAYTFNSKMFSTWRSSVSSRPDNPMKPNSVNRVHAYVRAMFEHLRTIDEWKAENPLKDLSQLRTPACNLRYLSRDEIIALFSGFERSKNKHVELCTKLALSTGARWNESEQLRIEHVQGESVRFHTGKDSAGGKWRTVPISAELTQELLVHHYQFSGVTGDRIFDNCYSAFREAIERSGIDLPEGQLTHILRHTFATTFLCSGGDLRTLQAILGHATITMTMRYAHLVEARLQQAKAFNPISQLSSVVFSSEPAK